MQRAVPRRVLWREQEDSPTPLPHRAFALGPAALALFCPLQSELALPGEQGQGGRWQPAGEEHLLPALPYLVILLKTPSQVTTE